MKHQDEHKVKVDFCDTSTIERTYLDTAWGAISAKDDYHEFVIQGQENDKVWARYPHVVTVTIHMLDHEVPAIERFTCPCSNKGAMTG